MKTVYQTDGSPIGFYTAVFDAYKDQTAYLSSETERQTELGERIVWVRSDEEKAARVVKKIRALDKIALTETDYVLRTPYPDKEQVAFAYLRLLVQTGAPVRGYLSLPEIRKAMDYSNKTAHEKHIVSGFLRFHETENGIFYAPFQPDNDIVELLMPHFFARFKNTPFVIHDVARKIAGLSDGKNWFLSPAGEAQVLFSDAEDGFLSLWKKYYQAVAIAERKNTRQMKGYMPVRYWKFMPEKIAEEERLKDF